MGPADISAQEGGGVFGVFGVFEWGLSWADRCDLTCVRDEEACAQGESRHIGASFKRGRGKGGWVEGRGEGNTGRGQHDGKDGEPPKLD